MTVATKKVTINNSTFTQIVQSGRQIEFESEYGLEIFFGSSAPNPGPFPPADEGIKISKGKHKYTFINDTNIYIKSLGTAGGDIMFLVDENSTG